MCFTNCCGCEVDVFKVWKVRLEVILGIISGSESSVFKIGEHIVWYAELEVDDAADDDLDKSRLEEVVGEGVVNVVEGESGCDCSSVVECR